jgi:eukaryotic-like serine/threonine-protein kinase
MLTGRLPFTGESLIQAIYQLLHEPPPDPRQFDASLPGGLARVARKALAKAPADRFTSAREMLEALEQSFGE